MFNVFRSIRSQLKIIQVIYSMEVWFYWDEFTYLTKVKFENNPIFEFNILMLFATNQGIN